MTFVSPAGISLAGWLDLPDGAPTAVALFAHYLTCGKGDQAATRIARGLADRGIAVLGFDFTIGAPPGTSAPHREFTVDPDKETEAIQPAPVPVAAGRCTASTTVSRPGRGGELTWKTWQASTTTSPMSDGAPTNSTAGQ